MTNIAKAIQQYPELASEIDEIIAIGGTFSEELSPPEFNIHCDPTAADLVLRSGIKITMIGLNVSGQIVFRQDEFNKLDGSSQALSLLKEQAEGWITRVEEMGWHERSCALHDAVAALYLIEPGIFNTTNAVIEISLDKDHWGMTSIQKKNSASNHQIVTHVKVKKCHDQIWSSIVQLEEKNDG